MSEALNEKPNAEPLPSSASAGVILDGPYLPPPEDKDGRIWVRTSALIHADAARLYEIWHDLENAPLWQEQIFRVTRTGEKKSHWVMASGDKTIEWDSEILADEPGRRIAWRSVGGESDTAGEVAFGSSPGGRATMVTVLQEFRMGKLASACVRIGASLSGSTVMKFRQLSSNSVQASIRAPTFLNRVQRVIASDRDLLPGSVWKLPDSSPADEAHRRG
jgi:hypothetical protein